MSSKERILVLEMQVALLIKALERQTEINDVHNRILTILLQKKYLFVEGGDSNG